MKKRLVVWFLTLGITVCSQAVYSGGWEASTLDTSFLYNNGNYAEVETTHITNNVTANIQGQTVQNKMVKDQTRTVIATKIGLGSLDFGLTSYISGALQTDGQAAHAAGCPGTPSNCSMIPSVDLIINNIALMTRYRFDKNISILGGINRYALAGTATLSSLVGYYELTGDQIVPSVGVAYEQPITALRVELVVEPSTNIGNFTAKSSVNSSTATSDLTGESMKIPQTATLNFQSGAGADTLVYGTIRQVAWSDGQLIIPAGNSVPRAPTNYKDTTSYLFGVAQKFSDQLTSTLSYKTEIGTVNNSNAFASGNGFETFSVGVRYKIGNANLSASYSHTMFGDLSLSSGNYTATYKNNTASAFGAQLAMKF